MKNILPNQAQIIVIGGGIIWFPKYTPHSILITQTIPPKIWNVLKKTYANFEKL